MKKEEGRKKMEPISNQYSNQYSDMPTRKENIQADAFALLRGEKVNRELDDLYSVNYYLKKNIPIALQYEDQCYVVIQENLNLGAEAPTLLEAERKLASQIVKLYERFSSLPRAQLGPYPLELLLYLKQHISS